MKRVSKYSRYFFLFFVLPIIIFFLGLIVFKSNFFTYKSAIIISGSMEPGISIDDLVFTRKPENMKVGDIVSYYDENGKIVMHRIVEINDEEVITKGDANNINDEAIKKSQVIGIYTGKIKYVGKVIRLIKSPMGLALFITILIFIVIFPNSKTKQKKNESHDLEKVDEKTANVC